MKISANRGHQVVIRAEAQEGRNAFGAEAAASRDQALESVEAVSSVLQLACPPAKTSEA